MLFRSPWGGIWVALEAGPMKRGRWVQKDGSVGGESSTRSFKKFGRKKEVGGLRDLGVQEGFVQL